MNVVHALLLFFVAIASAAALVEVAANPESPGDGKTEGSPNARLRGALSAEGVYVESDSFGDGEESRFETGAPEFLSCKAIGSGCTNDEDCCSNHCDKDTMECSEKPPCRGDFESCDYNGQCCRGNCIVRGENVPRCLNCKLAGVGCSTPLECCGGICSFTDNPPVCKAVGEW